MPDEVKVAAEPAEVSGKPSLAPGDPGVHRLASEKGPFKRGTQFHVGRCTGCGWNMSWVENPDEINQGHEAHLEKVFGSDADVSDDETEDSDG